MQEHMWSRRRFLQLATIVPASAACGSGSGSSSSGGDDASTAVDAAMPDAPSHLCAESYPRLDLVADCGAAGDGIADDTPALQQAAAMLEAAGGGELIIPPGTYRVGAQTAKSDPMASGPYYRAEPMFSVTGAACLLVRGQGATLKIADGLHFGGFDRATGEPKEVTGRIQDDAAHVGRVIELVDCSSVRIEGLEIDGNCGALVLGGQWGDVDRQTTATGIWMNRCTDVALVDVHVHHHGLDGVTVLHTGSAPTAPKPHALERVVAEYNGRQGLSWIGGWGLACTDCKFNHTGRAPNGDGVLASKPGAGVDIEPNAGTTDLTRDGLFTRCEFIDNVGPGMVTAGGDSGYAKFVDCTFWGTTTYAAWPNHAGLEFEACAFHGTVVRGNDGHTATSPAPNPALATRFTSCTFEDVPWTDGRVFRNNNLYTLSASGDGVTWTECKFVNHEVRSVFIDDVDTHEVFDRCEFVFSNPALANGSQQATLRGCRLAACQFSESNAVATGDRTYFIEVTSVEVADTDPPTRVAGPNVRWNSANGDTGDIAPGTYA